MRVETISILCGIFVGNIAQAIVCGGALDPVASHVEVNFIGAKVATFQASEYDRKLEAELRALGADLLILEAPKKADRKRLLEQDGYFFKPDKVIWSTPILDEQNYLNAMNSKERGRYRTKLKKSEGRLDLEIAPLSISDFDRWYPIYDEEVAGKDRGRRAIEPDWAKAKGSEIKLYQRLFFYDRETKELIGGVILKPGLPGDSLQAPYAAYLKRYRDWEIPIRAFSEVMNYGRLQGFKDLSYGMDSNLYGHHLSVGLMEFKASLGLIPRAGNDKVILKVLNPAVLNNDYFFFGLDSEKNLIGHHFSVVTRQLKTPKDILISFHALSGD